MAQIVILSENTFSDTSNIYMRGSGAHRISTFLRLKGYDTEVIDFILRWSMDEFQTVIKKLIGDETLMLGISSNLFGDDPTLNEKLFWFKSQYPDIPIVLGGNHLGTREIEPVDYLIEGYAESALLHLLQYFEGKVSYDEIKWSDFLDDKRLIDAIRDYPHNDTHDLTIRYQDSDFLRHHETLGIETARGCIFKCRFCTYPLIGKKKTDFLRDHRNIRDELLYNYETHGTTNYIIAEDTFNDSVEKLENLASAVESLPFRPQFVSYLRFDLILAKPHTLDLLRTIGIRGAYFGIESLNDEDSRLIRKGNSSQKIKEGLLWWTQEAEEIATYVSMIIGLPNTTEEQAWRDNEWLSKSGINWWAWGTLYFADTAKNLYTSDFSHNYQKYGYELMAGEELQRAIDEHNSRNIDPVYRLYSYNTITFRQRMTFWKHTGNGLNFFKATELANKLNLASTTRKLAAFHIMMYASLGYKIDDIMTWGYYDVKPHVPEEDSKQRTKFFIDEYIKNKINYDYAGRINNYQKLSPKIIPIRSQHGD